MGGKLAGPNGRMTVGHRFRVVAVAVCFAAGFSQAAGTARIVNVAISPHRLPVDQFTLQIPKFHNDLWLEAGDEIVVEWVPRTGGSEAGTLVRLHYLQQRQPDVQTLEVAYPFRVTRPRSAAFSVTGRTYAQWGGVTAWRVQVLENGQVVDEKRSTTWP